MVELSVAGFRATFGNFFADATMYPNETVEAQLDEARIEVSEAIYKKYYRRAAYYLTAHFLVLFQELQSGVAMDATGASAANSKGVVSSVSVGDLSLTQDMPEYSSSSDDKFLASTIFGQEFIRLRNKMSRGTLLARVPQLKDVPPVVSGPIIGE